MGLLRANTFSNEEVDKTTLEIGELIPMYSQIHEVETNDVEEESYGGSEIDDIVKKIFVNSMNKIQHYEIE